MSFPLSLSSCTKHPYTTLYTPVIIHKFAATSGLSTLHNPCCKHGPGTVKVRPFFNTFEGEWEAKSFNKHQRAMRQALGPWFLALKPVTCTYSFAKHCKASWGPRAIVLVPAPVQSTGRGVPMVNWWDLRFCYKFTLNPPAPVGAKGVSFRGH